MSRKHRCTYERTGLNIEPYHKKPKTVGAIFLLLNHPLRANPKPETQTSISKSWEKDILWMADIEWIGWNSNLIPSDDCTQENGTFHKSVSHQHHMQL